MKLSPEERSGSQGQVILIGKIYCYCKRKVQISWGFWPRVPLARPPRHPWPWPRSGVAERAELGEAREAVFGVTIPERAGAFREFCAAIGPRVITEFNYRLSGREQAHIFVGVGTTSREDAAVLREQLGQQGYDTVDLSDDEMAKLHVRHMVGGRVAGVRQERACRFEFPERPGALMDFLESLSGRWNISLFHYRNHGADFGRVLASFEVPDDELEQFELFLSGLGYHYELQSGNVAYDMFLA